MSILHCDGCALAVDTDLDLETLTPFYGKRFCPECLEEAKIARRHPRPTHDLDRARIKRVEKALAKTFGW